MRWQPYSARGPHSKATPPMRDARGFRRTSSLWRNRSDGRVYSKALQLSVSCHPRSQFAAYSDQPQSFPLKLWQKLPFSSTGSCFKPQRGKPPCAMQGGISRCSPRLSPQRKMGRGVMATATPKPAELRRSFKLLLRRLTTKAANALHTPATPPKCRAMFWPIYGFRTQNNA